MVDAEEGADTLLRSQLQLADTAAAFFQADNTGMLTAGKMQGSRWGFRRGRTAAWARPTTRKTRKTRNTGEAQQREDSFQLY